MVQNKKHARKAAKSRRKKYAHTKTSAASRVFAELAADVHYTKAIELGIANRSAIAAQLCKKLKLPPLAVKIAVTRWAQDQQKQGARMAQRTSKVLSRSAIRLQDDVSVLVLENNPQAHRAVFALQDERMLSVVVSFTSMTLIGPTESIAAVQKKLSNHALKTLEGLCLLQLSSTEEIEEVPGVYAAVLDALARKGINVLESSSCYTDTNIVVRRSDAVKAFEALEEACGKGMQKQSGR
ncbi:ACT domain-containing protein [Candidatus Micrarchaeota archaeon]|nr:ACT domain-containing protein [Candidatus Micrarchaeota archaeon]